MNGENSMMRGLCLWASLLALAGVLFITAAAVAYGRHGGILLQQVDNAVSRLFVIEAEWMSRAGEAEKALALYNRALDAGFDYPPDKSRTLAAKGLLLWEQGQMKDAVETLSASVSGSTPRFKGAGVLVEALLHLRRGDEAASVVRHWREAPEVTTDPLKQADMLYSTGRVAQYRGDVEGAREAYDECTALVPGGLAEYRIATLCANAGDFAEARRHLQLFLLGGASGDEASKARELCRALPPPSNTPQ